MKTWAGLAIFLCASGAPSSAQPAEKPAPVYRITEVDSPAPATAISPSFARADDGTVWLLWLEPAPSGQPALRCATFDSPTQRWRAPQTIFTGRDWVLDVNDAPTLTAGSGGQLAAAWTASAGGRREVLLSRSTDSARTWSAPAPLAPENSSSGFPALTTLADGRVLAAWLGSPANSTSTALFARILDSSAHHDATLIAPRVNESSAPALVSFPDGSALLSYRGRTDDNVRDLHVAHFSRESWTDSRALNSDLWRTPNSPAGSSPRLARDGGRVVAAWFTAADDEPRILLSTSSDAGGNFLLPLKADLGRATGPVDTVLLHDGAALMAWIESPDPGKSAANPGGLWLRRATPQSSVDEPMLISPRGVEPTGHPRTVLLRDFSGDSFDAQLLVAYTSASGLHTLSVTVPEADLLATATEACGCGGAPAQLIGFPFRGTLLTPLPAEGILVAQHPALPGLLPAGTHRFRATPGVIASVAPGQEFIGHIEQRSGDWWLFDIRVLVAPPDQPRSRP